MMLPILISLSLTPGSYFFCAAAGFAAVERLSVSNASRMPRFAAMPTSPDAAGFPPMLRQSRVLPPDLSSFGSNCDSTFRFREAGSKRPSRSADGGDHVGADAPFNGAAAVPQRQRLRACFRGGLQAGRIAGLDFISQRRSLAIGDRRLARGRRPADVADRLDSDLRKSRHGQLFPEHCHIVIAVRGTGEEARRILWEHRRQCFGDDIGEFVFGDLIPHIEKEAAAGFQYTPSFLVTQNLVGKEHRAELTRHSIETLILERQRQRVGLPPCDA